MFLQTTITAFQLMFSTGMFAHEMRIKASTVSNFEWVPLEFEEEHVIFQKWIVAGDNLHLLEFELVPPPPGPVEFE
jgi:hypothetical protein